MKVSKPGPGPSRGRAQAGPGPKTGPRTPGPGLNLGPGPSQARAQDWSYVDYVWYPISLSNLAKSETLKASWISRLLLSIGPIGKSDCICRSGKLTDWARRGQNTVVNLSVS